MQTETVVYKIMTRQEWDRACTAGSYEGSPDDARDGYIHLSAASQIPGTAEKYFRGQSDLILIAFKASDLAPHLKWEPSRNGQLFPHVYASLPAERALWTTPMPLDENGIPRAAREVL
jgi:uncharacterized protein (DUF952 family)